MRRVPRPLSAVSVALASAVVGLVLVTPAATASAAPTTAAAAWSGTTTRSLDAAVVAERRAALEAAAPSRTTTTRAYTDEPSLKACYGTDRTSAADGTPFDVATYGAFHGCVAAGSWLFPIKTHAAFVVSELDAIEFVADTDGNAATGCGGFEYDVFGFWSTQSNQLLAGVFSTPDCSTDTLLQAADLQAPSSRDIGLQFSHASIGGGTTVRWFGGIKSVRETAMELVPTSGFHTETGFAGGTTPAPAPTGADGCPTSGNSWYAATSDPAAVSALRSAGLDDVRRVRGGLVAFTGDRRDAEEALDGVTVRRDVVRRLHAVPNDPGFNGQWALPAVRAAEAWDLGKGSRDVVVAVLDTGADATHPDLQDKLLPGYDAITGRALPGGNNDPHGHGTAIAGLIAAATDNGVGLAGLGWNTRVLPVRVADAQGSGTGSSLVNGIRYAADRGAKVISISLGSCMSDAREAEAIRYAQGKGALVVASAGNEALEGNPVEYPAAYPGVLAVGATGRDGSRAVYSNTGTYVDMVAPGGSGNQGPDNDLVMLKTGGGTTTAAGTSFSAPLVAAAAALMEAARPDLTAVQLADLLVGTARDGGAPGRDDAFGAGNLDAHAALRQALATPVSDAATPRVAVSDRAPAAGTTVRVEVRTSPEVTVELYAASRPSTTYGRVRQAVADGNGVAVFSLAPSTTSQVYAVATSRSGRPVTSAAVPITVSARVSTPAPTRRAALTYRFTGSIQPGRSGVPVTLYSRAANGSLTKLAATRTAAGGRWAVDRRFAKAATVTVVARTTADATNAAGTSAPRRFAAR